MGLVYVPTFDIHGILSYIGLVYIQMVYNKRHGIWLIFYIKCMHYQPNVGVVYHSHGSFFSEMFIIPTPKRPLTRSLPDLDLDETDLGGTLDPRSFKRG